MGLGYLNMLYESDNIVSFIDNSPYNTKEAYNADRHFVCSFNMFVFTSNTCTLKCLLYQSAIYVF